MRVRELVALDVASANEIARLVRLEWDAGNAVIVLDDRLPQAGKARLIETLGVHTIVTTFGRTRSGLHSPPMDEDDAVVIATSGTSGEPKGVVHTHNTLRAASLATSAALRAGAEAHWLACLPLSHVGGFGVLTRAWHTGARLTIHDGFDSAAVNSSDATHVSLVPTALARIDSTRFTRILLGARADGHVALSQRESGLPRRHRRLVAHQRCRTHRIGTAARRRTPWRDDHHGWRKRLARCRRARPRSTPTRR
ncbi:MAG: hypothetical protein EBV24_06785 [Actinobacteria bacterium]|nr:hypothetical protein [Actinomycetota bacterium]